GRPGFVDAPQARSTGGGRRGTGQGKIQGPGRAGARLGPMATQDIAQPGEQRLAPDGAQQGGGRVPEPPLTGLGPALGEQDDRHPFRPHRPPAGEELLGATMGEFGRQENGMGGRPGSAELLPSGGSIPRWEWKEALEGEEGAEARAEILVGFDDDDGGLG